MEACNKSADLQCIGALDLTTEWIKESIEDELSSISDESSSSSGADHSSKSNISPTLVLNNGYLKLLQWDYHKTIPEVSVFQCLQSSSYKKIFLQYNNPDINENK